MAGTIDNNRGFTLIEILITMVIVAILTAIATVKYREVSYIHDMQSDLDQMIAFFQEKRLTAFTLKTPITITVGANQLTNNLDGDVVDLENSFTAVSTTPGPPATFSINTRGLYSDTGSIHVTSNPGTQFSCVVIDNSSIREGQWNGAACNAK